LHFKKLECPSEKAFHFQNAAQSLDEKKKKKTNKRKWFTFQITIFKMLPKQSNGGKNMLGNMLSNYTKINHCRSLNVYFTPKINFFEKMPLLAYFVCSKGQIPDIHPSWVLASYVDCIKEPPMNQNCYT
jgi:hypothetical protein